MANENAYVLKVLTGAQAGAEVSIAEAEYVLGSGPDDDLHFVDVSLKPGHARLRLEGGAIKVAGGAGTLKTRSGINILAGDETWQDIDALDVITIGTTSFAIGSPSADWSDVQNFAPGSETRKSANPPPIVTQPKWGVGHFATMLGAIVVLLLAASWMISGPAQNTDRADIVDDRPDLVIVTSAFDAFPFARDIVVTQEVDGVIEANGYVDTPAERRALRNAIDETAIPVRFRVWSRAVIENETQAIVDNQQIPVQFSVDSQGVLTLRGDVLDQRRVDRLVATLTENVAGLTQVDVQVQTANTYLEQIRDLLTRSELDDSVILRLEGMLIEANGVVVSDRIDNWVGFIQSYSRRYADKIALRSYVQLVDENGRIIADPVSAQPGLPVIIGSVDALEQGPLADPAFSPVFEELTANSSTLSTTAFLNNALNSLPGTARVTGGRNASGRAGASIPEATPIAADANEAGALQANQVGVILDLDRLKEGSFGAEDVFEGLNNRALSNQTTVQQADVSVSDSNARNVEPAVEQVAAQQVPIQQQFLNRASRPESIRGTRVLYNMTRAVLSDDTGVSPAQTYVDDMALLGDVGATLEQMKYLWAPTLGSQAAEDSYLQMLVTPSMDFTECWDNSIAAFGNLPYTLFWLDYLSVTEDVDVSAINIDAQVLLLEAALNPNRLAACAERFSAQHDINLSALSLYLQESRLNPEFIRYIVRQIDAYPFALSGVNMGFENRYAQLVNGARFNEGTSPDPSSLLVNVGELGLLVKEKDRLLVTVYDASLHWKSGG
ncbi:MAG: EscD/YscD/HrpQ family type III secretion system periplasmic domain-containing protein [Pseudomonadota bacterium]